LIQEKLFGLFMIVIGIRGIAHGVTAKKIYEDTEGPLSEEELERADATPFKRSITVGAGLVAACIGVRFLLYS
jgi:hypothetical protein